MPYLFLVVVAVVVCVSALVVGRAAAAEKPKEPPAMDESTKGKTLDSPRAGPLSREQLQERLKKLAATPPPQDLKPGAMCYDMAGPPETADYACPVCAAKTSYPSKSGLTELVSWQLASMRATVREIAGVDARLDERELCRKCMPKAPGRPAVVLVVKHADGREVRTRDVTSEDLKLLVAFTAGRDRLEAGQGREEPLKDHLPRLRKLLGLE